jgi:transcriptional regulator with XRE-family HTH domain
MRGVDGVRFGRGLRAIRLRRGWRQIDLARAAGVSATLVSNVELGAGAKVTIATLERIAAPLAARVAVRLDWRGGEDVDRLADAGHAALVELVVAVLRAEGWATAAEVSFSVYGERGSVDVLAFHPTGVLLIVEVKTVIPDVGAMLMVLDRKRRLAPRIGLERGWQARSVGRLLVVADGATARRRVAAVRGTFAAELPARNAEVKRWLRSPVGAISGLWFLSSATPTRVRKRAGRSPRPSRTAPR